MDLIDKPHNKVTKFQEKEKITPSQMGYRFEHEELKRLMKRLERFETRDIWL